MAMGGSSRNTLQDSRGQALVEFFLVALVLIVILSGVFDLGRAYKAHIVINNAAREGAFYGALHPWDDEGVGLRAVAEANNSGIAIETDDVSMSTSGVSGSPIIVTVDHDFSLFSSWLLGVDTVPLQGRAEMVVY
jgi:Flp pilus assembly protein TadG